MKKRRTSWYYAVVLAVPLGLFVAARGRVSWRPRHLHCWGVPVALVFSPRGDRIAVMEKAVDSDSAACVEIFDTLGRNRIQQLKDEAGPLAYSADGTRLYTTHVDTITAWDTAMWQKDPAQELKLQGNSPMALADSAKLLAVRANQSLYTVEMRTGKIAFRLKPRGEWSEAGFAGDGQTLLGRGPAENTQGYTSNDQIALWHTTNGHWWRTFTFESLAISSVGLAQDGTVLAVGQARASQSTVALYDTATGKLLRTLKERGLVNAIAFAPDGELLATAGAEHAVRLWNVATGRKVRELAGHTEPQYCVAFSPDGRYVASGGKARRVVMWRLL